MSLRWVVVVFAVALVGCGPPTGGLDLTVPDLASSSNDLAVAHDLLTPDLSSNDLRVNDMAINYSDGGPTSHAFGGCDTRSTNQECSDYDGYQNVVSAYQSGCPAWLSGGCPVTDRVGGCRNYDSSLKLTYTNWFYPPNTVGSTMATCPTMYVP